MKKIWSLLLIIVLSSSLANAQSIEQKIQDNITVYLKSIRDTSESFEFEKIVSIDTLLYKDFYDTVISAGLEAYDNIEAEILSLEEDISVIKLEITSYQDEISIEEKNTPKSERHKTYSEAFLSLAKADLEVATDRLNEKGYYLSKFLIIKEKTTCVLENIQVEKTKQLDSNAIYCISVVAKISDDNIYGAKESFEMNLNLNRDLEVITTGEEEEIIKHLEGNCNLSNFMDEFEYFE